MAATNPITMVLEELWDLLELNSGFTDLIPVGNRIKYSETGSGYDDEPEKFGVSSADLPEVRIIGVGGGPMRETSNMTFTTRHFAVQMSSGSRQMAIGDNVVWEIIRALSDWKTTMEALTWNSKTFVDDCALARTQSKLTDDRGVTGWVTVWAAAVQMHFTTSDLPP